MSIQICRTLPRDDSTIPAESMKIGDTAAVASGQNSSSLGNALLLRTYTGFVDLKNPLNTWSRGTVNNVQVRLVDVELHVPENA